MILEAHYKGQQVIGNCVCVYVWCVCVCVCVLVTLYPGQHPGYKTVSVYT